MQLWREASFGWEGVQYIQMGRKESALHGPTDMWRSKSPWTRSGQLAVCRSVLQKTQHDIAHSWIQGRRTSCWIPSNFLHYTWVQVWHAVYLSGTIHSGKKVILKFMFIQQIPTAWSPSFCVNSFLLSVGFYFASVTWQFPMVWQHSTELVASFGHHCSTVFEVRWNYSVQCHPHSPTFDFHFLQHSFHFHQEEFQGFLEKFLAHTILLQKRWHGHLSHRSIQVCLVTTNIE